MGALFDLADGPDAQLLKGLVIQFAAVVVAHARTRPDHHHKVNLLMNGLVSALLGFQLSALFMRLNSPLMCASLRLPSACRSLYIVRISSYRPDRARHGLIQDLH